MKLNEIWNSGSGDCLKRFLIWSSGGPFCSAEWNHLCNFGRGYQKEQFCEIILIFFWSSGSPPLQWSRTICAILKKGIMLNIHMKLYEIWTSGLGGDVV